jgi:hypothetical protein
MNKITKKDILIEEYNKVLTDLTREEINIKMLEGSDPNGVYARKVLSKDPTGKVLSTQDITIAEELPKIRIKAGNLRNLLHIIEGMIK